jgi:DNA polymerase III subunit delta
VSQAATPLKPAYAIWGEDRAKVERTIARLVGRVAADGGLPPERLDAHTIDAGAVVAACEALSFGGARLVLVEDADEWRADDAAPLIAYLGRPNPSTCLALVSGGPLTPKLLAAVRAVGEELRWGPDPKAKRAERGRWFAAYAAEEARRAGGSLSAPLARDVVARVGDDATAIASEVTKLVAYAGDAPIDREALDAVVVSHPDARAYELTDAIAEGAPARAYDLLQDLAGGDRPTEPIVVQATLSRQYRGIAAAQSRGGEASADDVAEATGLRGYPAQKAVEQARALPPGAGRRGVARLAGLELDLRVSAFSELGRSGDDGRRLVLELAVRDLLAGARRGPAPR